MKLSLTSSQAEAISRLTGNLQLIACAGSGKTEVVAQRVVQLLKSGSPPSSIVAFTFTDKAAAELKDRITRRCHEQLGEVTSLAEMFVGTIHAYCLDLLKSEIPKYLKYEVLNEVQQFLLIDRNSNKSGLTTSTDISGKPLRRYVDTKHFVTALSILRESDLRHPALQGCSLIEGLGKYQELLDEKSYLDYSGLMEGAVKVLSEDAALRERIGRRLRHVIIDEYQDVNPIQEKLVFLLHQIGASICVVGDDDQTIYQWRGGDVQNILTFKLRYPDVHQVRLQENFRSSQGVVETARQFITQNAGRLAKQMEPTTAQKYEEGDIVALSFANPDEEARFIAETITQLRGVSIEEGAATRGIAYSDCAILLRSVAGNAEAITRALRQAKIPYIVTGMKNLFETEEADAARHLFYFLGGKVGVDVNILRQAWVAADLGLEFHNLDQAIKNAASAREAILNGGEQRFNVYSLQRSYLTFLEDAGLREEHVPQNSEGRARGEVVFYNLGKFSQLISDFETINYKSDPKRKYEEFTKFLEFGASDAYPEGWQENQYASPDAVRIMTVHQAKGMEFPVVFTPALIKNRFPSKKWGGRSVWHLLPKAGIAGQARYEGSVEDERRLFYVAMTRSQKFLFMTWAPIPHPERVGELHRDFQTVGQFWTDVLASKWVKRRRFDYTGRSRQEPRAKAGVSNVVFSFSDLKYFLECPYQFKLRILYGFNAPIHEALGYGKSLHDALAEIHARAIRGEIVSASEVEHLLGTHLHVPYAYPALRENLERSAKRVLEQYFHDNAQLFDKIEFAEKTVEINLGNGVAVNGRIDLVRRIDTNETTIVDLKSRDRTQPEEVTEAQLHVYALGYRDLTGRNADYVEVYELDEGKRKPRSVDEAFIDDVKRKVHMAADSLRASALPPVPEMAKCRNCDYCRLCSSGQRQVGALAPKD